MLNRDLSGTRHDGVGQTAIVHDSVSTDKSWSDRGDNSAAPITETIAIADDGYRRIRQNMVRACKVSYPGGMHVQR